MPPGSERDTQRGPTGNVQHDGTWTVRNKGSLSPRKAKSRIQRPIREDQRRRLQMADGSYYEEAGNCRWREGALTRTERTVAESRRLTMSLATPTKTVQKLQTRYRQK